MTTMKKTLFLAAVVAGSGSAFAQTTFIGDTFEAMVLGSNPVGQAAQTNNTGTPGLWVQFGTGATSTVSNAQAAGGSQSVFIDRTNATAAYWVYPPLNADGLGGELDTPWTPAIGAYEMSVDVRFAAQPANTGAIGIDAYSQGRFARLLVAPTGANTASVLTSFPTTTGALGAFTWSNATNLNRDGWINLRIRQEMISSTQSAITFFVNNVPFDGQFLDGLFQVRYFISDAAGIAPSDFDVQQTTFGTTTVATSPFFGLSFPTLDHDYFFDNYRVTTEGPGQPITLPLNFQGTEATWVAARTLKYRLLDASNNVIHSWYAFTGNEGTETIVVNVPGTVSGNVTIEVDGGQFLKRRVPVTLTGGAQSLPAVTILNGDVDNNGEVDLTDIDLIIAAYLTAGGNIEGNIQDLDNNGEVDLTDIDIAISNYLLGDDN